MRTLNVRVSDKLKDDFRKACLDSEISESSAIRILMTNYVRSNKRQNGKGDEPDEVTPSKTVSKATKTTSPKRAKKA